MPFRQYSLNARGRAQDRYHWPAAISDKGYADFAVADARARYAMMRGDDVTSRRECHARSLYRFSRGAISRRSLPRAHFKRRMP